jgi:hypothetical protein
VELVQWHGAVRLGAGAVVLGSGPAGVWSSGGPNGGRSPWPAGAGGGGGRGWKEARWSTGVEVISGGEAVAASTVESGGGGLSWRSVERVRGRGRGGREKSGGGRDVLNAVSLDGGLKIHYRVI